jgi:hypothetical protein
MEGPFASPEALVFMLWLLIRGWKIREPSLV